MRVGSGIVEQIHDLTARIKCPGGQTHLDLRVKDLAPDAFNRCWFCGSRLRLQGDDGPEVEEDLARSMGEPSRVLKVER